MENRYYRSSQRGVDKERPTASGVNIVHDAGPEKLLRLLDTFLAEEAAAKAAGGAPLQATRLRKSVAA